MSNNLEIQVSQTLEHIAAEDWDRLVVDQPPFLEYNWLYGLEVTDCVSPDKGWLPQYITAWRNKHLVGAIPLYLKGNSYGEFVYDWSWAHAASQVGVEYYPKIIAAVPFTPVSGARILLCPSLDKTEREEVFDTLLSGALTWAHEREVSGLHFLFLPQEQARHMEERGFLIRLAHQYHWKNHDYKTFDDFLARFRAKKRTQIKRERRELAAQKIRFEVYTGDEITPERMEQARHFYLRTCRRFGPWTREYLNRAFYERAQRTMAHRLQLMLAFKPDNTPVAGTITLRKDKRWYGRYWGCDEHIKFLHFNACYYFPIEWAIQQGVQSYEPGQGGDHKYARGFEPVLTYSAHWIADPRFAGFVKHILERERNAVNDYVDELSTTSPLKPQTPSE